MPQLPQAVRGHSRDNAVEFCYPRRGGRVATSSAIRRSRNAFDDAQCRALASSLLGAVKSMIH